MRYTSCEILINLYLFWRKRIINDIMVDAKILINVKTIFWIINIPAIIRLLKPKVNKTATSPNLSCKSIHKDNDVLKRANIIIKGTSTGTSTNLDGIFKIKTSEELPVTIVVCYLGFIKKEIIVKCQI